MKEINISKIEHKRILGRNCYRDGDETLSLFWGGAALEINVKACEVYVCLSSDYADHEQWISVEINGAPISRFMVNKEKTLYCIARNLNPQKENLISIIKDVQPMSEDSVHWLLIHSVSLDDTGVFCPVKARDCKIEVIGDSITAGEGLCGAPEEQDWISLWMRASGTYGRLLARKMNADWNTMGKCGWGIICGWDGNLETKIPPHYENVCSVMKDEKSRSLGAHEKWDFYGGKGSDYVIINLGTNDDGGLRVLKEKGDTGREEELTKAVTDFLKVVRKNNPSAKIIWVWGMLGLQTVPALVQKGVDAYKTTSGDKAVYTLELESLEKLEISDEGKGSRGHPGAKTHQAAASRIYDFIKSIKQ
jgi:lysophospholipase L1-like esterase